jgi:hypothetical protein
MTEFKTPEIPDEIIGAISRSQAAVVDAIGKLATTVQSVQPELPEINLPFADSLKLSDRLPRPEDLVKTAYDFAEQLLATQRKFAEDVVKATAPLMRPAGSFGTSSSDSTGSSDTASDGTTGA